MARVFTVRASDVARCPVTNLSPRHYRDDGECCCVEYGVRFMDGSVSHRWNGRTARQRATEERDACRAEYTPDRFELVRRLGDGPWEVVQ